MKPRIDSTHSGAVTPGREAMLARIRLAVAEGNRAGQATPLPARGNLGYQGTGSDPIAGFEKEFIAAGGFFHRVPNRDLATARILHLLKEKNARPTLLGRGSLVDSLNLIDPLRAAKNEPILVDGVAKEDQHAVFFAAGAGITGVDFLIAETGTVVLESRPDQPRSLSLLPPLHIAVADRRQLLPDLFDLFGEKRMQGSLPACVSLITGPSKTGDIELRLVTGVHGPGEIHVLFVDDILA